MTQTEHLKLIRARCVELLEIAEKRTAGVWSMANGTAYMVLLAAGGPLNRANSICTTNNPNDTTFIASCAGAAEAGWRATIKTIDLASKETGDDMPYNTFDRILDAIIDAWPIELLNNK